MCDMAAKKTTKRTTSRKPAKGRTTKTRKPSVKRTPKLPEPEPYGFEPELELPPSGMGGCGAGCGG